MKLHALIQRTVWYLNYIPIKLFKKKKQRVPWWSSGKDFTLPMQGAQVQSLVGALDPACCN